MGMALGHGQALLPPSADRLGLADLTAFRTGQAGTVLSARLAESLPTQRGLRKAPLLSPECSVLHEHSWVLRARRLCAEPSTGVETAGGREAAEP